MSGINDLISFLDASPSAWHAADTAVQRLVAAGFVQQRLEQPWADVPDRGLVVRGAAVVAWDLTGAAMGAPVHIVGAHTDSPCLKLKPRPETGALGWKQLGVEVYGGALLNSWLDRDLGIAGRVVLVDGTTADVTVDAPICRVPQLAIHLDREVNERGLVLDKQLHLAPVWGTGVAQAGEFTTWLAEQIDHDASDVVSWDLSLFDRTRAALLGADASLLASGRLDNQVSCWAAADAITRRTPTGAAAVIALFDHEEVGSESTAGAAGPLLEQVLERLALARGASRDQYLAQLAASMCVSADNAHAVHPNYVDRHEPEHRPLVNKGPAIKLNSNQRYATSATTSARLQSVLTAAGVPWQTFVSRNNMPCGSTIGPITATRLGIDTVDVGVPQLSMHSARELCGAHDPVHLADGLTAFLSSEPPQ